MGEGYLLKTREAKTRSKAKAKEETTTTAMLPGRLRQNEVASAT